MDHPHDDTLFLRTEAGQIGLRPYRCKGAPVDLASVGFINVGHHGASASVSGCAARNTSVSPGCCDTSRAQPFLMRSNPSASATNVRAAGAGCAHPLAHPDTCRTAPAGTCGASI